MPTPSPHPQAVLPLHLTLLLMPWLASSSALALSKNALNGAKRPLPQPSSATLSELWYALLHDPALARAAEKEARKRAIEFLEGIYRYQQTPFSRDVSEPACAHTLGSARLLDYGSPAVDAKQVLLIPSLINRYYVLDLTQKMSFARYLRSRGIHVFILDWGTPSQRERDFDCALYITQTLVPMAQWIRSHSAKPLALGGYCMGGLLALALAQIRPDLVSRLALFATPWDFFAASFPRLPLQGDALGALERYIDSGETVPAETIHLLFHTITPYTFHARLRDFAKADPAHPQTQEFLAIEHWANDGVPMTRGVARDCLIHWTQYNAPARQGWHVGGQVIDPARLHMPCFIAAPQEDRIVPSACALPLANLLPEPTIIASQCGHVGMIVGRRRKRALWDPFCEWLCV